MDDSIGTFRQHKQMASVASQYDSIPDLKVRRTVAATIFQNGTYIKQTPQIFTNLKYFEITYRSDFL